MIFDKLYWQWLCHLHQPVEKIPIDPLIRKCECGHKYYFNKLHYILMLLFDSFTFTCPNCQRKHQYKLIYHCVEEYDETRIQNNELTERKELQWKNP